MTREEPADISRLTAETIEGLEESDYEGDWDETIRKVSAGFPNWFANVILPAAQISPENFPVESPARSREHRRFT